MAHLQLNIFFQQEGIPLHWSLAGEFLDSFFQDDGPGQYHSLLAPPLWIFSHWNYIKEQVFVRKLLQ
jgi:hypothetical protein